MRKGILLQILIRALWFAVVAQAVPAAFSIIAGESIWWAYAAPGVALALLAHGISRTESVRATPLINMRRREGFVAVVAVWLIVVLATAIAYGLTGEFQGFAHAFFESMSGYTTTGASVVSDIDNLPSSILFMRAFSHWMGGMGIIVLSVAILPELAVGGMQLFSAEATGIGTEKLAPRIAATARRLWVLYFFITALEAVLLYLGPMNLFDSVCHAMATIATGGFSTKSASIAHYQSVYVEMVILVFMFLAGINFTLQYRALFGRRPKSLFFSPEVRMYTIIILGATILIALNIIGSTSTRGSVNVEYNNIGDIARDASFSAVSIATTTGFGTADFEAWPHFSQLILVGLMFIGGCAGSTAGGTKVIRLYVLLKHAGLQMSRLIRPKVVRSLRIGDQHISQDTTEGIMGYYLLYFIALVVGSLIMTAIGMSLVSGTTASVSALNSIGPGLEAFGPTDNFAQVPDVGLYLLSFGMLLGRLEMYPLLVFFTVYFWRRG